jgi:peptide chain release factor 1
MMVYGKQLKSLQVRYELSKKIKNLDKIILDNTELLKTNADIELQTMLEEELKTTKLELDNYEKELITYLTPIDKKDEYNIFLEIRAGAGGDESSLFAGEILRSYTLLSQELGFSLKVVDFSVGTVGGYKDIIAEVRGDSVYSWFKYESGVHRVQRVPETEKQGRVHTSTVSVAIMPLIEESGNDFKLDMNDVEIIVSTSSGAGGQSVNTTYSAIQVVHKPTGLRAQCQDERNQQQNKIKAIQILTSRVYDYYESKRLEEEQRQRKEQVGTADRSEKIRTYNFPQDRLTDHRYNRNWNQLTSVMNGGLLSIIKEIRQIEAEMNLQKLSSELNN